MCLSGVPLNMFYLTIWCFVEMVNVSPNCISFWGIIYFKPFLRWLLSREDLSTELFHLPDSNLTVSPTAVKCHVIL